MMKKTTKKFITLEVKLQDLGYTRTIVIPDDLTMAKLANVIIDIFGFEGGHLWEYDMMNNPIGIPSGMDFVPKRDGEKIKIRDEYAKIGVIHDLVYDFGDGWGFDVKRIEDSGEKSVKCIGTTGLRGVDDIGGSWYLKVFTKDLRKYVKTGKKPEDENFNETFDWLGFNDNPDAVAEFLREPTAEEITKILRKRIR